MGIEGVWRVEMLGPYGWETISTAFSRGGQYLAGNINHHSIGTYDEADGRLQIQARVTQHGESRTIFAETSKTMDLRTEGAIDEDGIIVGGAFRTTCEKLDVKVRMTRLGDID